MPDDPLKDIKRRLKTLEDQDKRGGVDDSAIALATRLHDLGGVPSCFIKNTNTDLIANNTWETITYNFTRWATDPEMVDLTNGRIYFREEGLYLIIAQITWTEHATNDKTRGLRIVMAGGEIVGEDTRISLATDTHKPALVVPVLYLCDSLTGGTTTQYAYAQAFQDSGAALRILASSGATVQAGNNFMAIKLGNF